ncbi:MAG: AraC family transcriptional regulator [Verrucomicrobiota bacterium]
MKTIRPLIIQKLNLSMPGITIHQVRIHRHLPEAKIFRSHRHRFSQIIIYLGGGGHQSIASQIYPIRSGSLFWIPRKTEHAFKEMGNRKPLCLIVDMETSDPGFEEIRYQVLSSDRLHRIKGLLAQLSKIYQKDLPFESFKINSIVLDLLYLFLCSSQQAPEVRVQEEGGLVKKVRQLLRSSTYGDYSLDRASKALGYQKDYLNRLLKQQSGLTLGQIESQEFLQLSKALLQKESKIAKVSEVLGFPDQNYFARWFKRQSHQTPSEWQKNSIV